MSIERKYQKVVKGLKLLPMPHADLVILYWMLLVAGDATPWSKPVCDTQDICHA